jgi:cell division protein FtsL
MFLRKYKNKPFYKIFFLVLIANFFLHAINMNVQAVKGAEFKKYETEISVLKDEISNLNFKISSSSSLSTIEEKAKKLGFTQINSDIQVISTSYALKIDNEIKQN